MDEERGRRKVKNGAAGKRVREKGKKRRNIPIERWMKREGGKR